MDPEQFNKSAWEATNRYLHLKAGCQEIETPYFTNEVGRIFGKMLKDGGVPGEEIKRLFGPYNNMEVPFGWYRGKGSPQQLEDAVIRMAREEGVDPETFSKEGAREFMLLKGLGVDCSGFAYNVLLSVIGEDKLAAGLDWGEGVRHEVYKAGAFTFAGRASESVLPVNIQPLDLLLFKKNGEEKYYHVALILKGDGWQVVQSTSTASPMGVGVSKLEIENGELKFGFSPARGKDWNQLYKEGRIELRRLKILM